MLTATGSLAQIRPHYSGPERDLFRILLNATSLTEANLALQVLRDVVPEKVLVNACNLREVLRALPSSPFSMRVDEETLARALGLDRRIAAMDKQLNDGIELAITTAGSLVLDVIVRFDEQKLFWNPVPITDDFVNSEVVDLCIDSDYLLNAIIEMAQAMGVVFNPKFYLSLDDWHLDNAADVFDGLDDLF
ncbi:MAG TPA: hypothetical protein VLA05_10515 [Coriobacteriia bacterium]|nr:hypothetical protein [Coriobacteriia bacterium]